MFSVTSAIVAAAPGDLLTGGSVFITLVLLGLALIWAVLWFMVPFYIRDIKRNTERSAVAIEALLAAERARDGGCGKA